MQQIIKFVVAAAPNLVQIKDKRISEEDWCNSNNSIKPLRSLKLLRKLQKLQSLALVNNYSWDLGRNIKSILVLIFI